MSHMIYADNAATTKLDTDAFEAMRPYLLDQYANASQPYSFARQAKKALQESRDKIAACINAEPEEIFFTSGGTESDNWVIKGIVEYEDRRAVITSEFEHHAVLRACSKIETLGIPVNYIHPNTNGMIMPNKLKFKVSDKTKLVSIMMANNELGTIQPIGELSQIAHQSDALFHTDAVQAVGHIPVDVFALGVDFLSASAHKFNGPKGVGFLYKKKGVNLKPYEDGGAQEFGLRAGTENIAGIVGMATALEKSIHEMSVRQYHLSELERILLYELHSANLDFIRNGTEPFLPGLLSLSFRSVSGEMLLHRLDLMGIMVSTGSACDSKNAHISHVLQAIEMERAYAQGTIRISFGMGNSEDDAKSIAYAIIKIVKSITIH